MTHPDTLTIPRAVVEQALEGFDRIRRYGLDTLSGRTDGPDDRDWQRDAVNEMTKRARLSEEALRAALQPQAAAEPVNEWKEAVLDAVAAYSMDFRMDVPPCVIVNQLLGMAVTMAKDPAIRKEAATYYTEAEGDAYAHGFFDGLREPFPTTPPATQAENPLLKDYVEKAVAAERRKWQAALTAALEALKEIASMEGTESNEWDGVERVIPEMCAVAKAAIAQLEALGVKHGSV